MTLERFAYLADAYGADLRRWPAAEQDAAQALLDSGNLHARQTLATAGWLDRQLDSHQPACADPALARRIRQSATVRRSFWSRYADWLSPASLVGAGHRRCRHRDVGGVLEHAVAQPASRDIAQCL